jgi:hypothetical protein
MEFQHWGGSHVASETEKANAAAYDAQLKVIQAHAVRLAANVDGEDLWGALTQDVHATQDRVEEYGRRNGWSQDQITAAQQDAVTRLHAEIVDTLIQGHRISAAQAWYETYGDQLSAEGSMQVGRAVGAATSAKLVGDRVDAAITGGVGPDGRIDAAKVDKTLHGDRDLGRDPELLKRALQQAGAEIRQREQVQDAQDQEQRRQAWVAINRSPKGIGDPAVQAMLAKLPPDQAAQLIAMAAQEQPHADPSIVYQLRLQAARDPQDFAQRRDLDKLVDPRTPEFQELTKLQLEAIRNGQVADQGIVGQEDAVNQAMRDAKIDPSSEVAEQFRSELDRRVRAQAAATGQRMGPDRIRQIAAAMQVDAVSQPGIFWGLKAPVPLWQVRDEEQWDSARVDLQELDPALAAQAQDHLAATADKLGLVLEDVPEDLRERALAQWVIARDLEERGPRWKAEAQRARDQVESILLESQREPPPPRPNRQWAPGAGPRSRTQGW